jgi:hypothetical protein
MGENHVTAHTVGAIAAARIDLDQPGVRKIVLRAE